MTYVYIPMRAGSKGIPGKHMKDFLGVPLCVRIINEAAKFQKLNKESVKVVVGTDCKEIMGQLRQRKVWDVLLHDRSELSNTNDSATTESVMLDFIDAFNLEDSDNIMLVQATNPFFMTKDYMAMYKLYNEHNEEKSIVSVSEIKRFFWIKAHENVFVPTYDYSNRPRRQDFQNVVYIENGACYMNKVERVKRKKNRLNLDLDSNTLYVMPENTHFELDEPIDWEIAEIAFKRMEGYCE